MVGLAIEQVSADPSAGTILTEDIYGDPIASENLVVSRAMLIGADQDIAMPDVLDPHGVPTHPKNRASAITM